MSAAAARHAEIERRYNAEKRERTPVSLAILRQHELQRLFGSRYGHVLPDDDAGRDDALIMAHHLAGSRDAERRISRWLGLWAPWMGPIEVTSLVAKVVAKPLRWTADKLGTRLNLSELERGNLRITTIGPVGVTKAERAALRRYRARIRENQRRRSAGAKPRADYEANSVSRNKPWESLGMSRASRYRAGKPEQAGLRQVRAQHTVAYNGAHAPVSRISQPGRNES
jgi:hypothetical protein